MIAVNFMVLMFFALEGCNGARILGVVPCPSYSHQVLFRPIWKELAKRGHEVVVITTDPENEPKNNITEIDISFAYKLWNEKHNMIRLIEQMKSSPFDSMNKINDGILDIMEQELSHPPVLALLNNETEHFDLLIVEFFYPIMYGFSIRFDCPFIGVASLDITNDFHSILGNPVHPAAYPDMMLPFEGKLSFFERLMSCFCNYFMTWFKLTADYSKALELSKTFFGRGKNIDWMNFLTSYAKNVSMVFLNISPVSNVRPMGPAFVAIGGGTHLVEPKPLEKDLQEYLDGAKNGAIYFSLGTNVKSSRVPPEMRQIMLDAFRELPYTVLWKFDVTDIPNVPDNVKIVKWVSQQDVLRHPNVKLFITQGGLQSMEEAIFSNVPLVGIPFIADQDTNVMKMAKKGFGVYLDKEQLTKESLKKAILEVINNKKYKQRTIEIAQLTKDQPMTGLEKAVWWTEYVIRHKGAPHFRNPIIDLPFYQYYYLDVLGFILGVVLFLGFIVYKTIVFLSILIFKKLLSKIKFKSN